MVGAVAGERVVLVPGTLSDRGTWLKLLGALTPRFRFHDFERTMQLNYFGAVKLVLAFLPGMRQRGSGHIINVPR
ncbi:MAG: SDR family NAD(P)-dependent oxidoreductase [Candidatus Dormibacteraeota bacterium]|uniref:SDR family NAD(P)-dependent oxidoreductase n=1 Tax=Candidatus Dormiibacter inghamiae TaxID=3127013 RepID=A0A934ND99_9BACT|nr:SDR family NAD(P)-dependent oxidoreductase [Candidatus Dormibacteraeota bacterium]MBJ7604798.1 SDR family NAD(P)-dependent oxidoreductase [Candidatus Dormibacteraeota bacterium]